MNASEFKLWLESRDVDCRICSQNGQVTVAISPRSDASATLSAESSDLEEAIRCAQLLYDLDREPRAVARSSQ